MDWTKAMNANTLADELDDIDAYEKHQTLLGKASEMLRHQQAEIKALRTALMYVHPVKELTDEIEDLKNELMMEEESYMLLNESFLFAKESIKQQQIKIKELETKTLTDEEILTAIKSIADDVGSYKEYENTYEDGWLDACNTVYDEVFAILRKAQEK